MLRKRIKIQEKSEKIFRNALDEVFPDHLQVAGHMHTSFEVLVVGLVPISGLSPSLHGTL